MNNQYVIVNQCLAKLRTSNIPQINKLRIEIDLIKIKRALLNEEDTDVYNSKKPVPPYACYFSDLVPSIEKLCENYTDEFGISFTEKIVELKNRLESAKY